MSEHPDYAAHWAALLNRHKALIAAGCISPVGCRKVGKGQQPTEEPEAPADDNA